MNNHQDVHVPEKVATEKAKPFFINIEGKVYEWQHPSITVPQLRQLGGLPADQPVIEIDLHDNTERTLREDEIVEIKPGMGYAKKVSFKRG